MILQMRVDDILGIRLEVTCGSVDKKAVDNIMWASEWANNIDGTMFEQCWQWLQLTRNKIDIMLNDIEVERQKRI